MKYTYTIDNFNPAQGFLGVIYTPENKDLYPVFIKVPVDSSDLDEATRRIKENAPIEAWELELSKLEETQTFNTLVGKSGAATSGDTMTQRQERMDSIPIDEHVQFAYSHIEQQVARARALIDHKYSDTERDTWDIQREEARHVLSGGPVDETTVPYLYTRAKTLGVDITTLATKVLDKARERTLLVAELVTGHRQAIQAIEAIIQQYNSQQLSHRQTADRLGRVSITDYVESLEIIETGSN